MEISFRGGAASAAAVKGEGELDRHERRFWHLMAVMACVLVCLFLYQIAQADFSVRQHERRHKFGAVYMTLNNPFYEVIDEEIRTAVERNGDTLLTRDPALSVERQTEEVEELIASGVELIFLNPADWQHMESALRAAREAGVPVIAIDTNVEDEAAVAAAVESDNYMAGAACAEHLASVRTGGRVVLLTHEKARSAVDRMAGFRAALAKYPGFEIVDEADCLGQLEYAMPVTEDLLARHDGIDAIMALNDPAALGALAALAQAGRLGSVLVYGVDGAPETKEMIAKGYMAATAAQEPRQIGAQSAALAYRLLAGERVPSHVTLPTTLLTRENIAGRNLEEWE